MSIQHLLDAVAITALPPTKDGETRNLTPAHRLALMAIADDASDHTNLSWPGFHKICAWAMVKDRRAHAIIDDLIDAGYVERVQKAHTGRRTVYRVSLPPRPRHQPVDNPQKEGALHDTHSKKRVHSGAQEGALERTPLPINSPQMINQSSENSHQSAPAKASTTRSLSGWFKRRPHGTLDLESVVASVAAAMPDLAADAAFVPAVKQLAGEVLLKGGGKVGNPTAYVRGAFEQDHELVQRLVSVVGGDFA